MKNLIPFLQSEIIRIRFSLNHKTLYIQLPHLLSIFFEYKVPTYSRVDVHCGGDVLVPQEHLHDLQIYASLA